MDALFAEMMATLRDAQQAVEQELEQILLNQSSSSARLAHLQMSVGEFLLQARSLLEMMADSDAEAEAMNMVEELMDLFSDTDTRIAAMVKAAPNLGM
ncbi:hypothetical protein [Rubellimicrobium roseum]|uniref:Uncharacterized protein n=1 Tax=Rubellimicrobium roseum TaxID=687525 RepID=A0A5C4N4M2_9RHOB|nr:hypothetical protein [Rubellimicrobium roseum]TNC59804.1 hypothetical protein FHG71_22530 [Rubellimicrobium roseum]